MTKAGGLRHGRSILEAMLNSADMLLCAEDLGVIPRVCTEALKEFGILGNDVQRWVKDWSVVHDLFFLRIPQAFSFYAIHS